MLTRTPISKEVDQFNIVTVQFDYHGVASYAKVDFYILYDQMDSLNPCNQTKSKIYFIALLSFHVSSTHVVSHLLQMNDKE